MEEDPLEGEPLFENAGWKECSDLGKEWSVFQGFGESGCSFVQPVWGILNPECLSGRGRIASGLIFADQQPWFGQFGLYGGAEEQLGVKILC